MRILFLLAALVATPALAKVPNPPPLNGRPVVDAANIIPDAEEEALVQRLLDIERSAKHQVVVLTVPDMGGYEIEEYGVNAGRHYGIGSQDGDNGVLLTVAPNQRKMRIDVGYGLEPMLTDARSFQITEEMKDNFRDGDFGGGIREGVEGIAAVITPLTPEQIAIKQREEANRAARLRASWNAFVGFMTNVFLVILAGLVGFGLFKLATLPAKRRREREEMARAAEAEKALLGAAAARAMEAAKRRAEEARLDAEEEERQRVRAERAEAARKARIAAKRRAREKMLAAMTPKQRKDFLQKEADEAVAERERQERIARERAEERQREAARQAERDRLAAIQRAERRKVEEAEAAERRKRDEARRARDDEERRERNRRDEEDRRRNDSFSSSWSSPSSNDSFSGGGGSFGGGGASNGW